MKVVKWIFSVVLAIYGVLNLCSVKTHTLYIATGLIVLAVAALLCPALEEKIKIKYKGIIIVLLVLISLVLYYIIGSALTV